MPQELGGTPKDLGSVDDLVIEAATFGEREVLACREAMRSDGIGAEVVLAGTPASSYNTSSNNQ